MAKTNRGKTIAVFSAKGGVGKTVFTLNLAGIYKQLNKKVLIIDLDLTNGGIALSLNRRVDRTIYNLFDDLNNNRYKEFKDYVTNYEKNLDFIACPKDPRDANKIDAKYIDIIIERASYLYDAVILDTSHVLNDINLVALDKVDKILFLVTNDPLDLKNVKSLISIFKNLDKTNYKMILNNSCNLNKDYFSLYDIKNILKTNIDYILTQNFYIKNIDIFLLNGKIFIMDKKIASSKDYGVMLTIATDIFKEGDGKNE